MASSFPEFRRSELILIILGVTSMLILRAMLQRQYLQSDMEATLAKHISFLATVPVFFAIVSPALLRQRVLLARILHWSESSLGLIWRGLLIGCLCRILWWTLTTLRGSLGFAESAGKYPDLLWTFACPQIGVLILSIVTLSVVTPFVEELTNRGLIQTYFARHGVLVGILVSALVFMLFHTPVINPTAFSMGIVLAIQFHLTGSLWMSIATHAAYNGLIILDWHCLKIQWDPRPEDLPAVGLSVASSAASIVTLFAIFWLLRQEKRRR